MIEEFCIIRCWVDYFHKVVYITQELFTCRITDSDLMYVENVLPTACANKVESRQRSEEFALLRGVHEGIIREEIEEIENDLKSINQERPQKRK